MDAAERRRKILQEAWIGDAVLCLHARLKILRESGVVDGEQFTRMTSNQFLASFGDPSQVEAEIGRKYEDEGWDAACALIETKLMPVFKKQEEKRARGVMQRPWPAETRRAGPKVRGRAK